MNKNVIKNIVKLIIIFTAFLCSSLFKLIPVYLFNINVKNMSNTTYTLLTLFSDICILIIGLVLYGKELIKEWKTFKKKPGENFDIAFKYYFIGLAIMIGSNIIINFILKLGNSQNEQAVQGLIKTNPWLMLLFAGLFAPIIEELVFRKSFRYMFSNDILFFLRYRAKRTHGILGANHRAVLGKIEAKLCGVFKVPIFYNKVELLGCCKGRRGKRIDKKIVSSRIVSPSTACTYVIHWQKPSAHRKQFIKSLKAVGKRAAKASARARCGLHSLRGGQGTGRALLVACKIADEHLTPTLARGEVLHRDAMVVCLKSASSSHFIKKPSERAVHLFAVVIKIVGIEFKLAHIRWSQHNLQFAFADAYQFHAKSLLSVKTFFVTIIIIPKAQKGNP